jgi:methionyl-tRNA formyltransferase
VNVVFFGSGPFALPALDLLRRRSPRHPLLLAVTRPDRPAGRGRKPQPTPVRRRAGELGIECEAPPSANDPAYLDRLAGLGADLFIVADYGEMLRRRLRETPRIGTFNLHASLLPAHRGAAPVVHALLRGESATGVTLFRVEKGLDTGPIVGSARTEVAPLETAGELEARLARLGADLLDGSLDAFEAGTFRETPQDERLATRAPKLGKGAGAIDWSTSPEALTNFVRALNPWPGAFSFLEARDARRERTVFLRVKPAASPCGGLAPGAVAEVRKDGFSVRAGSGAVEVLEIQREGKAPLPARAYLQGRALRPGDRFSGERSPAEP